MIKIAFVGKLHSGKTTAVNKIFELVKKEKKLSTLIKFAQPLYDSQYHFTNLGKNRLFLQDLSTLAKKYFGNDILSVIFTRVCDYYNEVPGSGDCVLLCDDIRVQSDFDTAKECGFTIVGIAASDKIRKERNPKLFIGTDHETEIYVDDLIDQADILMDGDLYIDKFREDIEFLWNKRGFKQ